MSIIIHPLHFGPTTEAYSCSRTLGVPNVCTSFGTAPNYWNYLLAGMTLLPKWVLRDRGLMQGLARVSEPVVRLVDRLVRTSWYWCFVMFGGGASVVVHRPAVASKKATD